MARTVAEEKPLTFPALGSTFSMARRNVSGCRAMPFRTSIPLWGRPVWAVCSGVMLDQMNDGTPQPISLGFLGFGIAAAMLVAIAERGREFQTTRVPI